ncbi:glycoside hydrolase [Cyathus striatus]|nr:glycoside hydrolase [Cyathus striatus]
MLPVHSFQREHHPTITSTRKCTIGIRPAARWIGLTSIIFSSLWLFSQIISPRGLLTGPLGPSPPFPQQPTPPDPQADAVGVVGPVKLPRKNQVKDAFLHAYGGYMKHAFPHDELMSNTGKHSDKFLGWGVTLFDLSIRCEFYEALDIVKQHTFEIAKVLPQTVPFFETVIRYLGGLLSAHALSNDPTLLEKANKLATILLPHSIPPQDFPPSPRLCIFAEIASCQMEFKYLAKLTGHAAYYEKAEKVMTRLYEENVPNGLFAEKWLMNGQPSGVHYTAGANVDSGYEYFLKQYLLTGDTKARDQYIKSIEGIINNLIYITPTRNLLYITDETYSIPTHRQEHLACFLPGSLRSLHEWAAEGLASTCWITYADQPSGLGPDMVRMASGERWIDVLSVWREEGGAGVPPGVSDLKPEFDVKKRDYFNSLPSYYLRPETVESIYMLWKTTGDVRWRERGYDIFAALEKHAKTPFGYASLQRVDRAPYFKNDDMPSWFLAETLKYLYLLFDDEDTMDLDKWVFNTEAHPLPVFGWSEMERERYNITY